ncbi:tetratricopeptide repeat protein [Mangrovimicrobium sediminis]|uniref:Tetratricopeptide repeat protein n=1 Tax=Mangrovimicrobium sediminis TaxID=2562682 RepID=A0A4Z0M918_9GAMM|nr:SIR2 family protein [Haliea sp. SAOS-164]TGD76203.1 tetratricopeptide repeat protein [Haliea sp. SAOS-164]
MENEISAWILDKIRNGQAILFLGAGASYDAEIPEGPVRFSAEKLRDLICDRFLGGDQKDKSLVQVADYAKHQAGLNEVQVFIKNQFHPLQPANFHKLIPLFRWHSIYTTNYDLVIERAYDQVKDRLQKLAPIFRDGDQFSEAMRDPDKLPYFKLHGCISVINDENLPLILASEEYAKHQRNRVRLFQHLSDSALEHPIIFCGYKIGDPNIQQILFDLFDKGINRPNYMVVDPGLNKFDVQMWQSNRINPVKSTFAEFLSNIDNLIEKNMRVLGALIQPSKESYRSFLKSGASVTPQLLQYLSTELEHVYDGMPVGGVSPKDFYTGLDDGWAGINQDLDVERKISDQLLIDAVIDDQITGFNTFLIKGYAGSGKSVCLRRVSWNAARDHEAAVFYLKKGAVLRPSLVKELIGHIDGRLVISLDDALANKADLQKLYDQLEHDNDELVILTTSRSNEWNQDGGDLERYVSAEYELEKLSDREIDLLISKLEKFQCLGNLRNEDMPEVKRNFGLTSDRQLLVALHEVTSGKPFEQIVYDEYQRINPAEAQLLYMDVCTLHRLNVPVRAGLVSRISGISIEDFKSRFIAPLEHLVKVYMDQRSRDYVYVSRHPLIAEFVFDQALDNPADKAEQIVRVISKMNIDYDADKHAFSSIIRGKTLAKLFSDKGLAKKIYDAAEEAGASPSYIWHQRAIFELNHPGAQASAAMSAINRAERELEAHRTDKSILHTKALIYKRMAKESQNKLEIDKYRAEARLILERLLKNDNDSRPSHSIAELLLDELEDQLRTIADPSSEPEDLKERALISIIKRAEDAIYKGLQRYPSDEYLLVSQAKLAEKLNDSSKVRAVLDRAYRQNMSSDYVAIALARNLRHGGETESATKILREAITKNPNSKPLHLELSKYLIAKNDQSVAEEIMHHLKRSFSPGDSNYTAQFWFARQHYLYQDKSVALGIFDNLKAAKMPPFVRRKLDGHSLDGAGKMLSYNGQVTSDRVDFGFIRCAELGDDIFTHISHLDSENSASGLRVGLEVTFNLAFSMRGPVAINVRQRY